MLGLIWIQTVDTLMAFEKVDFEKKSADDKKIIQNFPVVNEIFKQLGLKK